MASTTPDVKAREVLGEAIYNALYAAQGGRWECVETREVWYRKADKIIAEHQLPAALPSTPSTLAEIATLNEEDG